MLHRSLYLTSAERTPSPQSRRHNGRSVQEAVSGGHTTAGYRRPFALLDDHSERTKIDTTATYRQHQTMSGYWPVTSTMPLQRSEQCQVSWS
jgi:hypothetical protein